MRFNIDPKTRAIDNNYSKLGVQGENKVEVVEFVAPKIVGQADLSGAGVKCLLSAIRPSGGTLLKVLPVVASESEISIKWEVGTEETAEIGYLKIALSFSTAFDNVFKTLPTTFEVLETISVESEQPVLFSSRKGRSASFPILFAVEPEVESANVIENKIIFPARLQNLAMQHDNESRKINFIMARYDNTEDLSKYPIKLHLQVADGSSEWIPFLPVIVGNDLKLEWTVQRPHTSYAGKLRMQIEVGDIATDTFFKQTEIAEVNILNSLDGDTPIVPVSPPEFAEYLSLIEAVKQQAVGARDTAVVKAGEASTSATNAANSATKSATSATNARVSEENAKKSETGAAGSLTDIESGLVSKLPISDANQLFKSVTIDDATGIFTFTRYDDTQLVIDTGLEKVVLDMRIDPDTLDLVLLLADGTEQRVSLIPFLNLYTGGQTLTVDTQVNGTVITAAVKGNSIHLNLLTPELQTIINNKVTANQTGNASQVKFLDGKTMQEKLDAGDLNGKDGVSIEQSGLFYMRVDEFGHLKVGVPDGVESPPLTIRNGKLIYTIS